MYIYIGLLLTEKASWLLIICLDWKRHLAFKYLVFVCYFIFFYFFLVPLVGFGRNYTATPIRWWLFKQTHDFFSESPRFELWPDAFKCARMRWEPGRRECKAYCGLSIWFRCMTRKVPRSLHASRTNMTTSQRRFGVSSIWKNIFFQVKTRQDKRHEDQNSLLQ